MARHLFFLRRLLACCVISLTRWPCVMPTESRPGTDDYIGHIGTAVGNLLVAICIAGYRNSDTTPFWRGKVFFYFSLWGALSLSGAVKTLVRGTGRFLYCGNLRAEFMASRGNEDSEILSLIWRGLLSTVLRRWRKYAYFRDPIWLNKRGP